MAESVTIARPYAEALFRLASEGNSLAAWADRLERLATIARDPELAELIGNPKLSASQMASLVLDIQGETGNAELTNFVTVLAENERLALLSEIAELFNELKSKAEGTKEAIIYSAFPLDAAQVQTLAGQLEGHFKSKLQPRVEVDPSLIGGVRVAVGDEVLDASVRGKLDAMAVALKN